VSPRFGLDRRQVLAGAALAVVAAVAVAAVPLVAPSLGEALDPVAGPLQSLVALGVPALALLVLSLVRARRGRSAAAPPRVTWDPDPDRDGEAPRRRSPGAAFDRDIERATNRRVSEAARRDARDALRDRLRVTAARTYRRVEGVERGAAREAIAAGRWTDDPWAGAFLAETGRGPQVPWGEWLRAVFTPGSAVETQIRRTLDAVDRLEERA